MQVSFRAFMIAGTVAAGMLLTQTAARAQAPAAGQAPVVYRAARAGDGKPNLNGIWQAVSEANWDLEPHAAYQGPDLMLGAQFSVPPGIGVVEGGAIPYKPEALAKKKGKLCKPGQT